MAPKSMAGQESREEGAAANVIRGPWAELPHRGEHAAFYDARDISNWLTVNCTAIGTQHIWTHYRAHMKTKRWPFVLMQFDGNPDPLITHDYLEALDAAILKKLFVYNYRRRAAWRPVWYPGTPIEVRSAGNHSCEPLIFNGYKSFIPGWEKRPRAHLFTND